MMDTDEKLLELSAKAAKYNIRHLRGATGYFMSIDCAKRWNPLDDDGDALRLAVRLQIAIYQWDSGGGCTAKHLDMGDFEEVYCGRLAESVYCEFSANRRAIVRAAAEIGRAMP